MRLNAYLARAGVSSRRGADELIKAGRVKVNGQVGQLNSEVGDKDRVELNGRAVSSQNLRYILLYKPAGYVTTLKDPEGRRIVTDLVNVAERVVPVGRLDYGTTGALLLTNDGGVANKLMHPRYGVEKTYEAEIIGTITPEILNQLSIGVRLEDGMTKPAKVRQVSPNKIEIIIHEGRNHQIKRMLGAVNLSVRKLHRSKYGAISLGELKPGEWREIPSAQIKALTGTG